MSDSIYDLRSAIEFLKSHGDSPEKCSQPLESYCALTQNYVDKFAGVPASSATRQESMVLYENVVDREIPVLMGMFGCRKRNQLLLSGSDKPYLSYFLGAIKNRTPPKRIENPLCQQVIIDADIDLLKLLPIQTLTSADAGPYITLGLILANDPDTGYLNASINRLCVQGKNKMTVSIYPGHHLGILHKSAQEQGKALDISINIGLDPLLYFASCLTEPLFNKGDCELDVVGAIRGKAVNISNCISVDASCISNAEIVIEAQIGAEKIAENPSKTNRTTMPEFLGYQGEIKGDTLVPVVDVTAITHRTNPIYQHLAGPGREQSELQSITPELVSYSFLKGKFDIEVLDVVYASYGGGLMSATMQINKNGLQDDKTVVEAGLALLKIIPPLKHLYIVDSDIDPYSSEDIQWALTTRFQIDLDLYQIVAEKAFAVDPSQTAQYRNSHYRFMQAQKDKEENSSNSKVSNEQGAEHDIPTSVKALFDCTVPWDAKKIFQRPFHK